MSLGDPKLWSQLAQAHEMPRGPAQIAAVERLMRQVDAAGEAQLAFAVRMLATAAYRLGGEPAKSFVTFSWCLADYDRNPQPYHERHRHSLLWQFKWMVNGLTSFPEVPLDRAYAVLDDMERRYRDGGHSLQAVYKCRHRVARHIGAADEAAHWYRLWTTTPRDDLSDCAGCDPSSQAHYLAEVGDDEAAIALAEPVLAGELSCTEQPHGILTSLLLPYLRSGRREAARDAHRQAYRRVRGNLADLWDIGEHVEFCALTGNEARGLELVERHLEWLDRAPSPSAAMDFAAASALLLRRLDRAGHGGLTVHRRGHGDRPAADVPVARLATELAELATAIAARFDARNGTDAQSRWVERRMAREPIGPHLPLSATARRGVAATARRDVAATAARATPGPATSESATSEAVTAEAGTTGAAAPAEPDLRRPAPSEVPADAGPAELLRLAEEAWRTVRRDHFDAVLHAFDERFGAQDLPPDVAGRRLALRAVQRYAAEDPAGAREAGRAAIELFRRVPDPVRERIAAGRLGLQLCRDGAADEGLPLLEESVAFLAEHGTPAERADGYDRLGLALVELERFAEAYEALDRAGVEAAADGDPYQVVRVGLHLGRCRELLDRPRDERAARGRALLDLARELDLPEYRAAAAVLYARALADPAEAVPALDEAVSLADGEQLLQARIARGRALLAAGRPDAAVDDFVESVALCAERGLTEPAAFLRWELAEAYRHAERLLDAAEAAEEAVAELDKLGFQGDADRCRHLLANVYVGLGEDDLALALLDELAGNLDGPDNLGARGQVTEEAGELLYRGDRDGQAARRFAAAAESYRLAGLPLDELRARRREVDARYWAGETAESLAAVERADALAGRLSGEIADEPGTVWERAMLDHSAARALYGDERVEAALERLAGVPERLREIQAFGEAAQVELFVGEVLLRLDRPAEAEALLRRVLGGLPAESQPVRRAAWLLAQALAALGRTGEADALRAEHDLADDE
ncbi:hypothetical protein AB0J86_02270 [Micromonospora sp. NPDC049559]|uniref:hypothetical protein n=1 Tax=Micromonospora sp. NPDC049559 TaxID=3155923 RepID=UPI003443AA30